MSLPTDSTVSKERLAERIVEKDGQWYFKVRNEQTEGPYACRADAEAALARFLRKCEGRMHFSLRSLLGTGRAA